jgi:Holliday junction DNA helicase RuvA
MIAKLKGIVESSGEDFVILDVHGVGYLVYCSSRTLGALPRPGQPATLAVETQMREDSIRLYGFLSDPEREMFRLLQSVQGVGAKVALAIQSILDGSKIAAAIAVQDKSALSRASGVGPKLAARIVAELRDKVPAFGTTQNAGSIGVPGAKAAPAAVEDAIMVLVNLGYGRTQAVAAVAASAAELGDGAAAAELIRRGLKELSQ